MKQYQEVFHILHYHFRLILEIIYFATFYKNASYTFSSNNQTVYGQPKYFSIAIPDTNKNINADTSFVNFIFSIDKGKQILESQGLNYIKKTNNRRRCSKIPSSIKISSK